MEIEMSESIRQSTAPRIFFDEPVTIIVGDQEETLIGRALNISNGGIFICAPKVLAEEQAVVLKFCLPDGDEVVLQAAVIRSVFTHDPQEPAGMALRFAALEPHYAERIDRFISGRLQPATGDVIRLKLGDLGFPITAKTQSCWDKFICVDAELPFLRLGSTVALNFPQNLEANASGCIRWVSVHVPPETSIPRLNIGIEFTSPGHDQELEEDTDPVCNQEFADHSKVMDAQERTARKTAAASHV
jgi:hypothetical protein